MHICSEGFNSDFEENFKQNQGYSDDHLIPDLKNKAKKVLQ